MIVYILQDISEIKEIIGVFKTKELAETQKSKLIEEERSRLLISYNDNPFVLKHALEEAGWWLRVISYKVIE